MTGSSHPVYTRLDTHRHTNDQLKRVDWSDRGKRVNGSLRTTGLTSGQSVLQRKRRRKSAHDDLRRPALLISTHTEAMGLSSPGEGESRNNDDSMSMRMGDLQSSSVADGKTDSGDDGSSIVSITAASAFGKEKSLNIIDTEGFEEVLRPKVDPFENSPEPVTSRRYLLTAFFNVISGMYFLRLLALAVFVFAILCAMIGLIGTKSRRRTLVHLEPLSPYRKLFLFPAVIACRAMLFFIGVWRIQEVSDGPALQSSLFVSNHISLFDVIYFAQHRTSILSKASVADFWPANVLAVLLNSIWVDRESNESKQFAMDQIRYRLDNPKGYPHMVLFPEGTTTNGKALIQFRAGAFSLGAPVTPFCISFPHRYYNPGATGNNCGFRQLIRMSFMLYIPMKVIQMETIIPSAEDLENSHHYSNRVQALMAARLECERTNHSFNDFRISSAVQKAGIVQSFEFCCIRKYLKISVDQFNVLVSKHWATYDRRHRGKLSLEEMCRACELLVPPTRFSKRLFSFLAENGVLEFRSYLYILWLVSSEGPTWSQLRLVFALYCREGAPGVLFEDICALLKDAEEQYEVAVPESLKSQVGEYAEDSELVFSKETGRFDSFVTLITKEIPELFQIPFEMAVASLRVFLSGYREVLSMSQ